MQFKNIYDEISKWIKRYLSAKRYKMFFWINGLVLGGYSVLRISYKSSLTESGIDLEISQGNFDLPLICVLLIINIGLYFWTKNYNNSAAVSIESPDYNIEVGYYFPDGTVTFSPHFIEKTLTYFHHRPKPISLSKPNPITLSFMDIYLQSLLESERVKPVSVKVITGEINKSFYPVVFCLKNTGKPSLKHIKLIISFDNNVDKILRFNKESKGFDYSIFTLINTKTYINENGKIACWKDQDFTLVQGDMVTTDPIYIKPVYPSDEITVYWELLSDEFKKSSSIKIPVEIILERETCKLPVDISEPLKPDEIQIKDYIEYIVPD